LSQLMFALLHAFGTAVEVLLFLDYPAFHALHFGASISRLLFRFGPDSMGFVLGLEDDLLLLCLRLGHDAIGIGSRGRGSLSSFPARQVIRDSSAQPETYHSHQDRNDKCHDV